MVAFAANSGSEQTSNLKKPEIERVSLLVNVKVAQAAIRAGCSEKTPGSQGSENL